MNLHHRNKTRNSGDEKINDTPGIGILRNIAEYRKKKEICKPKNINIPIRGFSQKRKQKWNNVGTRIVNSRKIREM